MVERGAALPFYPPETPMLTGITSLGWRDLFFGGSRTGYHPWEVMRLLMKRLHQQYSEIRKMPLNLRDYLFKKELADLEKEQENPDEL